MKSNAIAIIAAVAIIGGAFIFATRAPEVASTDNVTLENGKQIVTVTAKGKYNPHLTAAKADMPTILRVETSGTFDCTAALKVPAANYQAMLPPTGVTDIELPAQQSGSIVRGLCAMGMYNFDIEFN